MEKIKEFLLKRYFAIKNFLIKHKVKFVNTFEVISFTLLIYFFQFFFTQSFNWKYLIASFGAYFIFQELMDYVKLLRR